MKSFIQKLSNAFLLVFIASLIVQCKKDSITTTPIALNTEVTNVNPLQVFPSMEVTITGNNFDTTRINTNVTFNGVAATVNSITSTKIVVTVPYNATSGKIVVRNNNMTITYPTDLVVNYYTESKIPVSGIFPGKAISNIAVDASGSIYCNTGTDTIFKVSPAGIRTIIATVGSSSTKTKLGGIAVDARGNIFSVGTNDFKIYKITSSGTVGILAGNGVAGYTDGPGISAQFSAPVGLAIDPSGNLYVTDVYRVRKITSTGVVTTFAGNAAAGNADGQGTAASFGKYGNLSNIAIDASGSIYVSDGDPGNGLGPNDSFFIRKITSSGAVTTIGPFPVQLRGYIVYPTPFTTLFAVDSRYFYMPGTVYSTGTTASGGCCTIGPLYFVDRSASTSLKYDITSNVIMAVYIKFTAVAIDPAGNVYTSASVGLGPNYYFGTPLTYGSIILKVSLTNK